tara:strand:+ start:1049 stop:1462 length:414 start_codon:yes stop_codon:yes gene_type:complete
MPEPVGIDISVAEDVTTIAVTSEDAINVAITEDTTDISVSAVPATTTAASITYDSYASITAETVQGALEALADQFFRQSATPSGTSLSEGDLWYDTVNEQLKVYRQVSGGYEWQALVSGGYVSGETSSMDKLDGGLF